MDFRNYDKFCFKLLDFTMEKRLHICWKCKIKS